VNEALAMLEEVNQLQRVRTDPLWFMQDVLNLKGKGWDLDIWQNESTEAIADVYRFKNGLPTKYNHDGKTMFTIRAMHGPGKTFWMASIMHWFNNAFRGRIICTAPKENQLKTRLWPAFRKILQRAGKPYSDAIKVDSLKITWHNDEDWVALAETAAQSTNIAGHHDDYMMFLVDEASGVNEHMYPAIEGALSTGIIVILVLIGNPTKNQGTFHASHCIPKVAKHYFQVHVDLAKTTRVSHEWVQRMVDKYGRNSPVVKVRCYGEFADSDESQLIPYAWIADALGREDVGFGNLSRLRITVDVADGGLNFTVITAARIFGQDYYQVIKQEQHSFPSSESPILAAKAARDMFIRFGGLPSNGDDIVVDSLGVGAGTAGYLMQEGLPIITYKGGEASDDIKQWRNRRTQSYIVMRDAFRDKRISFAEDFLDEESGIVGDWDDFTAQMCSVRTIPGTERVEELETKKAMMMRGIVSPDRADSCALIFATQTPNMPGTIGTIYTGAQSEASKGDW
jgi:hypothetical protein